MTDPDLRLSIKGKICHWCKKPCGGTCLGLTASTQMKPSDPAYWMLKDGFASKPQVYRESCYICNDPEFAAMGLPLCRPCPECSKTEGKIGHIPADDEKCSECGAYEEEPMEAEEAG